MYSLAYIAIEGIYGSGKTTLFNKLLEEFYASRLVTHRHCVFVKEPHTNTILGALITELLKKDGIEEIEDEMTRHLLFSALRREQFANIIWPAIKRKNVVISDRSYMSMHAERKNVSYNTISSLSQMAHSTNEGWVMPNYRIFLNPTLEVAKNRVLARGEYLDEEKMQQAYNEYQIMVNFKHDKYDLVLDSGKLTMSEMLEIAKGKIQEWATKK